MENHLLDWVKDYQVGELNPTAAHSNNHPPITGNIKASKFLTVSVSRQPSPIDSYCGTIMPVDFGIQNPMDANQHHPPDAQ